MQSHFNFDLVCVTVNQKAREEAVHTVRPIGARDRFNTEQCRLRWSYLHLVVSKHLQIPPNPLLLLQRKAGLEPGYTPEEWSKDLKSAPVKKTAGKENDGDSN